MSMKFPSQPPPTGGSPSMGAGGGKGNKEAEKVNDTAQVVHGLSSKINKSTGRGPLPPIPSSIPTPPSRSTPPARPTTPVPELLNKRPNRPMKPLPSIPSSKPTPPNRALPPTPSTRPYSQQNGPMLEKTLLMSVSSPEPSTQSQNLGTVLAKTTKFLLGLVSRVKVKGAKAKVKGADYKSRLSSKSAGLKRKTPIKPQKNSSVGEVERSLPPGLNTKSIIVSRLITVLKEKGVLEAEGIFRVSGNKEVIDKSAEDLLNGIPVSFENEVDFNNIGDTLKRIIKNVEIFEDSSGSSRAAFFECGDESKSKAERVDAIKGAIAELPAEKKEVLEQLLGFCKEVVENKEKTKMTPKTLATCLAPNMIKEKELAIGTDPQQIKKNMDQAEKEGKSVSAAFEFMIVHQDEIFKS